MHQLWVLSNYNHKHFTGKKKKKQDWCSNWHEENQMSWFSISSLKLVTCTLSLEISLQFFPWCTAPLSHFLWNGERVWERMTSCALAFIESLTEWINKSINQSTHKFSSEVNVLGHWLIQVNEATHSSGDETLCSNQTDHPVLNFLFRDVQ